MPVEKIKNITIWYLLKIFFYDANGVGEGNQDIFTGGWGGGCFALVRRGMNEY
ncbi:MAG: hypothetical protein OEV89_11885 [Desulfobulbaceae bacterium]|nr:hypothetical protein [Desulfobulbaceae bacterium]HIJ91362.1 hypothetical protein [Deltaproteobacteria bacterium]